MLEQDGERLGAECVAVGGRQATAQVSDQRASSLGRWAQGCEGRAVGR